MDNIRRPGAEQPSLRMERDSITSDGMAEIKSGRVNIINPQGNGKLVTIIPTDGVIVRVNGMEINEQHEVHSEDMVELEAVNETIPPVLEIKASPDLMLAQVKTVPEKRISYSILDQDFRNVLSIKTEKEEMVTRPITVDEIKQALNEKEIVYGIDEDVVANIASSMDPVSLLIANGEPMEEGKDGYLEYLIKTEKEAVAYDNEEAKVDYRERYTIPQVNEGQVIAILHPPVEGVMGKTITGEDIVPPEVKHVAVNAQDGVMMSEDNTKVIAVQKGRPVVKHGQEDIICIEKYFVHNDDVNMESGNIYFHGHLKVEGNVEDGMSVFADGSMIITKNVAGAKVMAGDSVSIEGNCINSSVEAGGLQILCEELTYFLEMIKVSLEMACDNVEQIVQTLKKRDQFSPKKFPYVLQTLLQTKYPELPDYVGQLKQLLKEKAVFSPPANAMDRIKEVIKFFLEKGWAQVKDENTFYNMYTYTEEATTIVQGIADTKSDITIHYAQNSQLKCTGDILLTGPGSYNSNLECSGVVKIEKLFRGGNIIAGDDIIIGELGSPGSSRSRGIIQVPEDKSIKLAKVHEGTRLKVGERQFRLDSTYSNIRIFLDKQEDKVKVAYWK